MITREDIIQELADRGYKAEAYNSIKNGVVLEGIRVLMDSNIMPIIYTDPIIEGAEDIGESVDYAVDEVIRIFESHKNPQIDINQMLNEDFIREHIYIALQKEGKEPSVKRSVDGMDGIESYLYIRSDSGENLYSFKLSYALLEKIGIGEDEAWTLAEKNTFSETMIVSLAKIWCEMKNLEYEEEMDGMFAFWALTNSHRTKGASAILDKEKLKEFAQRHGCTKIVAIPSSVDEFLIGPYDEGISLDTYSEMVKEVNESDVDPVNRLADKAFVLSV